jgi:hypothetical protein
VTVNLPYFLSLRSNALSKSRFGGSRLSRIHDQSEWQIEWQRALVWARPALVSASVCSCVRAGQAVYLGLQNCTAIHGKEKVYGSIP